MGTVALVGDATTTTSVALAAAWPNDDEAVVVEFDPSGGSLSAWMDTPVVPSLSTFVAARSTSAIDGGSASWRDVESIIHGSASGLRFIVAPTRAREAARSITEASSTLLPLLSTGPATTLIDLGRRSAESASATLTVATDVVVVHRQDPASPAAASVRIERLVESVELLATWDTPLHLGIIGDEPFDVDEVAAYVAEHASVTIASVTPIAVDPLSAMAFAGRTGVSAKRLNRLPLLRSIAPLADLLAERSATVPPSTARPTFETTPAT